MDMHTLEDLLNRKVEQYNQPHFIQDDPISIPHLFTQKQDIEISAFFAALFSWGNRRTIVQKGRELMGLMDNKPYRFCMHFGKTDAQRLTQFRHRTFNPEDLLYLVEFFRHHYAHHESLETAFSQWMRAGDQTVEAALSGFYKYIFPPNGSTLRTRKHIASPERNSSCKRLNMFLRWMVRKDQRGVDFGIWKNISPAQLVCPVDVHVARVSKRLGMLNRKQVDWKSALEITAHLRNLDKRDPVKYDFALFGMGIMENF